MQLHWSDEYADADESRDQTTSGLTQKDRNWVYPVHEQADIGLFVYRVYPEPVEKDRIYPEP